MEKTTGSQFKAKQMAQSRNRKDLRQSQMESECPRIGIYVCTPDTRPCVAFCSCKVPTSGGHYSTANSTLRIRHVLRLILSAVSQGIFWPGSWAWGPCPLYFLVSLFPFGFYVRQKLFFPLPPTEIRGESFPLEQFDSAQIWRKTFCLICKSSRRNLRSLLASNSVANVSILA